MYVYMRINPRPLNNDHYCLCFNLYVYMQINEINYFRPLKHVLTASYVWRRVNS